MPAGILLPPLPPLPCSAPRLTAGVHSYWPSLKPLSLNLPGVILFSASQKIDEDLELLEKELQLQAGEQVPRVSSSDEERPSDTFLPMVSGIVTTPQSPCQGGGRGCRGGTSTKLPHLFFLFCTLDHVPPYRKPEVGEQII